MNLTKTTCTALAIIPKETKAKPAAKPAESAPVKTDSVDIKGFDGDTIPADDDGPGAGGGYKPQQDPVEGPGAGGGYDADEIPADDDGPGAGGGYDGEQDPAESDGPGAGGGYFTEESASLSFSNGSWNQPLAVFSTSGQHDIDVSTQYTPHWVQVLPSDTFSWAANTMLEPLLVVDANGKVQPKAPAKIKEEEKK